MPGLVLTIVNVLTGCSGYQYVASPRFVPLNEKKGELTVNVHPSAVQVGYAFGHHVSAFATGFRRVPSITSKDPFSTEKDHRYCTSREVNLGASYFWKHKNMLFETLIGAGQGDMTFGNDYYDEKIRDDSYHFSMRADRRNVFVQPNFGLKFKSSRVNKHLALGAFVKLNLVHYYNIAAKLDNPSRDLDAGIAYFADRTAADLFFVEPGVIVKGGSEKFRGSIQFSPVINAGGQSLRHQMFSYCIGATMRLDMAKEK